MKQFYILLMITLILSNCTKNPSKSDTKDNFSIHFLKDTSITIDELHDLDLSDVKLLSKPWLSSDDIEFYDFSTHYIYLKTDFNDFWPDLSDQNSIRNWHFKPFVVCAFDKPCYFGYMHVSTCASMKHEVYISDASYYDYDDIFILGNSTLFLNDSKHSKTEARNDSNLKNALKEDGIYHAGLEVLINNVTLSENSDTATVEYTFTVTNNDDDNLYVMDPDRIDSTILYCLMGLILIDENNHSLRPIGSSGIDSQYLENWNPAWFTKVNSGKSITRTITAKYQDIPSGHYYCKMSFDSDFFIQKNDRILTDGRYWVGKPAEVDFFEIEVE